jgi:hypothetical protein
MRKSLLPVVLNYYPMIVDVAGRPRVIVRTNPVLNFGQQIGRDRALLARSAGADDSHWKKLDDWLKSDAARGDPQCWAREELRGSARSGPRRLHGLGVDQAGQRERTRPSRGSAVVPSRPGLPAEACRGLGSHFVTGEFLQTGPAGVPSGFCGAPEDAWLG